jgi:hypothetical protein
MVAALAADVRRHMVGWSRQHPLIQALSVLWR